MAVITTHKGGAYYEWRVSVIGSPPPATFNEDTSPEGVLYHDWQHGVSRNQAYIHYQQAIHAPAGGGGGTITVTPPPAIGPPPSPPAIGPPPVPVATVATVTPGSGSGQLPTEGPNPFGYNADQEANIYNVISAGFAKGAPDRAIWAGCTIGEAENSWSSYGCNSSNHCGLFQLDSDWQRQHDYHDNRYWAAYAYEQGFYGHGGLIHLANQRPELQIQWIVQYCQGAGPTDQAAADYYAGHVSHALDVLNHYGPKVKQGWKPVSATSPAPPSTLPTNSYTGIEQAFHELNWAGDDINLWKAVRGGSNEAAHMAQVYYTKTAAIKVIKPHQA